MNSIDIAIVLNVITIICLVAMLGFLVAGIRTLK